MEDFTNGKPFDVFMCWSPEILSARQCYNNAGSPTWGVRFDPKSMYEHVRLNAEHLTNRFQNWSNGVVFKVEVGDVFVKDN